MSFLSLTERDRDEMLAAIGVDSIDDLFRDIPPGVRFQGELDLEPALSEPETVNDDPYGEGWLIRVRMTDAGELDALMDAEAYRAHVAEQ